MSATQRRQCTLTAFASTLSQLLSAWALQVSAHTFRSASRLNTNAGSDTDRDGLLDREAANLCATGPHDEETDDDSILEVTKAKVHPHLQLDRAVDIAARSNGGSRCESTSATM